jgi:hypothetical protein
MVMAAQTPAQRKGRTQPTWNMVSDCVGICGWKLEEDLRRKLRLAGW